ncbi:hypothetical protein K458DRAFT_410226 [Lentithecium fluviatile CBS 122367]|uniref:Uncharacterized protein n=1 Tax=Lentithecium fluviatile CBS 122367 TaxID=1168545 RepID=A0A6G1IF45_9PLEO|nr:hypothetical protein K458DRAFT_410226 [Lentithecium fluviatile CBS 122367]
MDSDTGHFLFGSEPDEEQQLLNQDFLDGEPNVAAQQETADHRELQGQHHQDQQSEHHLGQSATHDYFNIDQLVASDVANWNNGFGLNYGIEYNSAQGEDNFSLFFNLDAADDTGFYEARLQDLSDTSGAAAIQELKPTVPPERLEAMCAELRASVPENTSEEIEDVDDLFRSQAASRQSPHQQQTLHAHVDDGHDDDSLDSSGSDNDAVTPQQSTAHFQSQFAHVQPQEMLAQVVQPQMNVAPVQDSTPQEDASVDETLKCLITQHGSRILQLMGQTDSRISSPVQHQQNMSNGSSAAPRMHNARGQNMGQNLQTHSSSPLHKGSVSRTASTPVNRQMPSQYPSSVPHMQSMAPSPRTPPQQQQKARPSPASVPRMNMPNNSAKDKDSNLRMQNISGQNTLANSRMQYGIGKDSVTNPSMRQDGTGQQVTSNSPISKVTPKSMARATPQKRARDIHDYSSGSPPSKRSRPTPGARPTAGARPSPVTPTSALASAPEPQQPGIVHKMWSPKLSREERVENQMEYLKASGNSNRRTIDQLLTVQFTSLNPEEKARLILPLLQGQHPLEVEGEEKTSSDPSYGAIRQREALLKAAKAIEEAEKQFAQHQSTPPHQSTPHQSTPPHQQQYVHEEDSLFIPHEQQLYSPAQQQYHPAQQYSPEHQQQYVCMQGYASAQQYRPDQQQQYIPQFQEEFQIN